MPYDLEGAPAFVCDMMEPERPKVDRAVLAFLKSEAALPSGGYYDTRGWGGEAQSRVGEAGAGVGGIALGDNNNCLYGRPSSSRRLLDGAFPTPLLLFCRLAVRQEYFRLFLDRGAQGI
jgi:hypothetical protein